MTDPSGVQYLWILREEQDNEDYAVIDDAPVDAAGLTRNLAFGRYCWEVQAIDGAHNTSASTSNCFSIIADDKAALPPPMLIKPIPEEIFATADPSIPVSIDLIWEAVNDPAKAAYVWTLQQASGVAPPSQIDSQRTPYTGTTVKLAIGRYCWFVYAVDAAGKPGVASPSRCFNVEATPG
ncbi:MAG: hypothetical protein JOZ51_03675 [Chloroflexi bacterium]|nr:hypothetical protein [Chloroflexota bacterium]